MPSVIQGVSKRGLIRPPHYVAECTQYEVLMGSMAYGVSGGDSDWDVYGFCIPNKDLIFPHLKGEIAGFGRQVERFEQFQQHHVQDKEAGKEYDFQIFNIVKFFSLVMDNNPNMVDALFVPQRCILHSTSIGNMVREKRHMFLHKGAWHRFKGYSYSQMHKMRIKNPEGKRKAMVEEFGYDLKFAYHVVRLLNEVEMILTEHDIDLERNAEQLKSIRRGEWTMRQIEDYFQTKEKALEEVYAKSTLRHKPDETAIKALLFDCLEEYFGSIGDAISRPNREQELIGEIEAVLRRFSK